MEELKDIAKRLSGFIDMIHMSGALMDSELDLIQSVETDLYRYIKKKEVETSGS